MNATCPMASFSLVNNFDNSFEWYQTAYYLNKRVENNQNFQSLQCYIPIGMGGYNSVVVAHYYSHNSISNIYSSKQNQSSNIMYSIFSKERCNQYLNSPHFKEITKTSSSIIQ
jgi:hypothetical protein